MNAIAIPRVAVVKALHRRWRGHLLLDTSTHVVIHREHGSRGTYQFDGARLVARWDDYAEEVFDLFEDTFVHRALQEADLTNAAFASVCGHAFRLQAFCLMLPGSQIPVTLRSASSDIPTFQQVFVDAEYASPDLPPTARHIVDLGANIGLSALFFGLRYPDAHILCLEPEATNFDLLTKNVGPLGRRVSALRGAVWSEDGIVNVKGTSDEGVDLGHWGAQVTNKASGVVDAVPAFHISTLLNRIEGDVDILKIDIEGAEREVFQGLAEGALDRVHLVAIETHDRFHPGSEAAVRGFLATAGFVELSPRGENLFFRNARPPRGDKSEASSAA